MLARGPRPGQHGVRDVRSYVCDMTIGFASRAAVSGCVLCAAGLLALAPAAATAGPRVDPRPGTPDAPASLLYRPGTHVRPRAGAPEVPDLSARSWLVADADTGEVLAAHDAHRRLPPASTLKTLFALTVMPALPSGIRHRVDPEELEGIGPGSSLVGVAEYRTYRVSDLWNGVFLNSGNDAVRVLAALSGGWRATAERMEEKARDLGARDTRVTSPDGYDEPGQVSSAFDLAVFGRAGCAARVRGVLAGTVLREPGGAAARAHPGVPDGGVEGQVGDVAQVVLGEAGVLEDAQGPDEVAFLAGVAGRRE
ncbi:hypothetical protein SALBM217S_06538 [Streptomyces griseoloalbus]